MAGDGRFDASLSALAGTSMKTFWLIGLADAGLCGRDFFFMEPRRCAGESRDCEAFGESRCCEGVELRRPLGRRLRCNGPFWLRLPPAWSQEWDREWPRMSESPNKFNKGVPGSFVPACVGVSAPESLGSPSINVLSSVLTSSS